MSAAAKLAISVAISMVWFLTVLWLGAWVRSTLPFGHWAGFPSILTTLAIGSYVPWVVTIYWAKNER